VKRLFGGEVHSYHTVLTGHEFVDPLLVGHDEERRAIVWKIAQTHTVSRSHLATASHAREYLPTYVCELDAGEEVVKPVRTEDGIEVVAEAVAVGE
jgi:hypothetical protein